MSALAVRQADDRRSRREFLELPYRLHRGDANWVPPLRGEQQGIFSGRTAFSRHAETALFVARRDGRAVARVAAIHNRAHAERYRDGVGFFGFFECRRDDADAGAGAIAAAEHWLAARGLTKIRGPVNPSMNSECGLLIEGFDSPPMALMPYNPPEYPPMLESIGFAKAKDLFAYLLRAERLEVGTEAHERLVRISAAAKRRHPELTIRCLDMSNFEADVLKLLSVFEEARRDNWGYVPLTPEEAIESARNLRRVVDPKLILLAEVDGAPAGAAMSIVNVNRGLAVAGGRLLPLGWLRFLLAMRRVDEMRIFGIAALERYRSLGITALLFTETVINGLARGIRRGEASWVLEDNRMSNRSITGSLEPELYKKYRIYEKAMAGCAGCVE